MKTLPQPSKGDKEPRRSLVTALVPAFLDESSMCGRFTQNYTWAQVQAFFTLVGAPLNLQPRYKIAPTTIIDVVRLDPAGRRELVRMRWGLVPGWWSKPLKDVPATFNARSETASDKTDVSQSLPKAPLPDPSQRLQ